MAKICVKKLYWNVFERAFTLKLRNHFKSNCVSARRNGNTSSVTTAGILIIGDEILKGLTEDVNTPFLIKNLNQAGIKISKIAVVPDDVESVAKEVSELSHKCSFVLTSGGIGPTHDDVTYEAVAKAFADDLQLNEELSRLLKEHFGLEAESDPVIHKFASIPKSAVLNYTDIKYSGKKIRYPLISVKNVFMLPGVPTLLQKSFESFKNKFLLHNQPLCTKEVFIDIDEFSVTSLLNEAVKEFNRQVKFGSYPTFTDNYYKVKLVLESSHEQWIEKAYNFLKHNLPDGSIINLNQNVLLSAKEDVYTFSKSNQNVSIALSVLEEALNVYALPEMCLCFNGGKDCTALLHLLYSCAQKIKPGAWNQIHTLYVKNGESFREVESFIQSAVKRYSLNLTVLKGDLKEATSGYLQANPHIKAMLMGTRKCDPGAQNLSHFSPTDASWPSVMRILPLLDWKYTDVWTFIRKLQVSYCSLYDRGYTSIGIKSETVQNSALLFVDQRGHQSYRPAYMLEDINNERDSRL